MRCLNTVSMWVNMSYLYNKTEACLSEHSVIMMPQFIEELDVWKTVCFILIWSRDDKATKPPNLAERYPFKPTRRYRRWLWMSYLKHQKLPITVMGHDSAVVTIPFRSYPFVLCTAARVLRMYTTDHICTPGNLVEVVSFKWILAQASVVVAPDTVYICNVSLVDSCSR